MVLQLLVFLFLSSVIGVTSLSLKLPEPKLATNLSTRRKALLAGASTLATTASLVVSNPEPSRAGADALLVDEDKEGPPERIDLLRRIAKGRSEDEVANAIAALERLDPSEGRAATSDRLSGAWELIYSVNAEAFSPLLRLPEPVRPTSSQLVGAAAEPVVGAGRIAQVLDFPLLPLSLILSSGTVPLATDSSVLEIFPPFRLEAKIGGTTTKLVESGSDAEFRALNARTAEAQAAGRNLYKQRYLETTGKPGDLRISEVIAGDPVLVGEVFVHRRI